ncbi:MAG: hypothetical protein WDM70_10135 [Nitrosomonadales bacterium]
MPDDYVQAIGEAVESINGIFVIDCIASGGNVDRHEKMQSRCANFGSAKRMEQFTVLRNGRLGRTRTREINHTQGNSFALDLKKWLQISEAYENGGPPVSRDNAD